MVGFSQGIILSSGSAKDVVGPNTQDWFSVDHGLPGDANLLALGGSGFGVMALLVAAERGFVPRAQVAERMLTIVRFLARADRFHGVWPHFLDGDTGRTIPFFGKFDNGGDLEALPYQSLMLAFTHHWTPRWRSTGTVGFVNVDNASLQADNAYNQTYYGSVNVIFQVFKRLSIGVEGLYGNREVKNGDDSGDVFRVMLGLVYSPFD